MGMNNNYTAWRHCIWITVLNCLHRNFTMNSTTLLRNFTANSTNSDVMPLKVIMQWIWSDLLSIESSGCNVNRGWRIIRRVVSHRRGATWKWTTVTKKANGRSNSQDWKLPTGYMMTERSHGALGGHGRGESKQQSGCTRLEESRREQAGENITVSFKTGFL